MSNDANGTGGKGSFRRPSGRVLAILAGVAAASGGVWCESTSLTHHARAAPAEQVLPQVIAVRPEQRDIPDRLGFLGQFAAVDAIEVRAQVGGVLTGVHFRDGDIVHKGDLLFTIDPVPYEIRLAAARAQLESAQARETLATREFKRAQTLVHGDAGSVENVDQRQSERQAAQAAIDAAQAEIRDAQFDLDHCRIIAPVTGRIGTHLVSVGNLVAGSRTASSPTTLLTTLVSLDPIWLNFDMSESDWDQFSRNRLSTTGTLSEPVQIALNGTQEYARAGTLDFVDNAIDRSSGVIHARATVPNPAFDLLPGAFARLRVESSPPRPTLLVPDAAVLPDQSRHIVLTVSKDGIVVPKLVVPGDARGAMRIIRTGLSPDDRVVIDGLVYAAPGAKVAVKDGTFPDHPVQAEN
jgi:membrane fusion protein, multidrug efflux system